jgi:hypothetical protein
MFPWLKWPALTPLQPVKFLKNIRSHPVYTACFNILKLCISSPNFFMCFLWCSECAAVIHLGNLNRSVLKTEALCVCCKLYTKLSDDIYVRFTPERDKWMKHIHSLLMQLPLKDKESTRVSSYSTDEPQGEANICMKHNYVLICNANIKRESQNNEADSRKHSPSKRRRRI